MPIIKFLPVVLLFEFFDAPAGFEQQLLAPGIKRVALRTDLDVYTLFRRTRYKFVPAAALHLRLKIFRLDRFPHLYSPPRYRHNFSVENGLYYSK